MVMRSLFFLRPGRRHDQNAVGFQRLEDTSHNLLRLIDMLYQFKADRDVIKLLNTKFFSIVHVEGNVFMVIELLGVLNCARVQIKGIDGFGPGQGQMLRSIAHAATHIDDGLALAHRRGELVPGDMLLIHSRGEIRLAIVSLRNNPLTFEL